MAFYSIDPWGDQRADMRTARLVWAALAPNSKAPLDENDYRLFPDEANDLDEEVTDQERRWMMKLDRLS